MRTIIKNETDEKEERIFNAYKKRLSKDGKTRFNNVEIFVVPENSTFVIYNGG